jgi:hypothetical protein
LLLVVMQRRLELLENPLVGFLESSQTIGTDPTQQAGLRKSISTITSVRCNSSELNSVYHALWPVFVAHILVTSDDVQNFVITRLFFA